MFFLAAVDKRAYSVSVYYTMKVLAKLFDISFASVFSTLYFDAFYRIKKMSSQCTPSIDPDAELSLLASQNKL